MYILTGPRYTVFTKRIATSRTVSFVTNAPNILFNVSNIKYKQSIGVAVFHIKIMGTNEMV